MVHGGLQGSEFVCFASKGAACFKMLGIEFRDMFSRSAKTNKVASLRACDILYFLKIFQGSISVP